MKRRLPALMVSVLAALFVAVTLYQTRAYASGTMTITGQVTDEKGAVFGHRVSFFALTDEGELILDSERWATTDEAGQYSIGPIYISDGNLIEQYAVRTANPGVSGGISEARTYYHYGEVSHSFGINRHGESVIRVLDQDGTPAPEGVPVWFSYVGPDDATGWPWNAPADGVTPHHVTGADGTISLFMRASYSYDGGGLGGYRYAYPAGQKRYGGIDQTYNMIDQDDVDHTPELRYEFISGSGDISAHAGKTMEYDFYVRPLGKLSAIARDEDTNQPVSTVTWHLDSESGFSKYPRYGDGDYQMSVYVYGGDTVTITANDPPDPLHNHLGHYTESRQVQVAKWGHETISLLMETNYHCTIYGEVTDPSGNGIPGARVELLWWECSEVGDTLHSVKTTTTGEDGSYTLTNVIPTPGGLGYVVRASKTAWTTDEEDEVGLGSGDDVRIDLAIDEDVTPPSWEDYPDFRAASIGRTAAVLEWREAQDDAGVHGYRICQGDATLADTGPDYVVRNDWVRQMVSNLNPGTPYTVTLRAYDEAGHMSEITDDLYVSFTTLQDYDPTAKVIRASVSNEGFEGDDDSGSPAISGDGRFVVFESEADNLCGSDENRSDDVFLFDRDTGQVQCISLTSEGKTGEGDSDSPVISADGRYVAFVSEVDLVPGGDPDYSDVFIYDTETGEMSLVSKAIGGEPANQDSYSPSLSGDGNLVAFVSYATNLVDGDTNDCPDVFVWNRTTNRTIRVSYQLGGDQITGPALNAVISANGRFVAYEFWDGSAQVSAIHVCKIDDLTTELVTRKHSNPSVAANGYNPSISADGRYIAFDSLDNDLVQSDGNNMRDVFVYDRIEGTTTLASLSDSGDQGNDYSIFPAMSADGRFVAFKSLASNLVPNDEDGYYDVFVRNLSEGTTERVSVAADGTQGDDDSSYEDFHPAISSDGRVVAFDSRAKNLVVGDTNSRHDVFVFDRLAGFVEPDVTAPVLSSTDTREITSRTAILDFTCSEIGTYYYLVYAAADEAPDASAIKAQGAAAAKGTDAASAGANAVTVTGLAPETEYKAYLIVEDAAGNISSVAEISFATLAMSDYESVLEARNALTFATIKGANASAGAITTNLNLLTEGAYGTTVSWEADPDEGWIDVHTGAVTRPAYGQGDKAVKLTATITKGSVSDSKDFFLTVKQTEPPPQDTGDDGDDDVPSTPPVQILDSSGNVLRSVASTLNAFTGTLSVQVSSSLVNATSDELLIDIPETPGAKRYESVLPVGLVTAGEPSGAVTIATTVATVTVPSNMLSGTGAEGAQNVSITIASADKSQLDASLQAEIGGRPVIELSLRIDGRQTAWSNENAPVTVSVPYVPTPEELEDPEHITVWYIDGDGNVIAVPNGRYDPETGTVVFTVTHFSLYAVVYVHRTFDDLDAVSWAKKSVEVLASKGILTGVSENEFAPGTTLTRGDFVGFLMKTLSVDAAAPDNFDDVSSDAPFFREIGAARKLGIAKGTGDNRFNPDAAITRQEMMVLAERALRTLGRLDVQGTASDLEVFADKFQIAEWALDSVASLVKEGLITGSGETINPLGHATKAEAAVFLHRIYNK